MANVAIIARPIIRALQVRTKRNGRRVMARTNVLKRVLRCASSHRLRAKVLVKSSHRTFRFFSASRLFHRQAKCRDVPQFNRRRFQVAKRSQRERSVRRVAINRRSVANKVALFIEYHRRNVVSASVNGPNDIFRTQGLAPRDKDCDATCLVVIFLFPIRTVVLVSPMGPIHVQVRNVMELFGVSLHGRSRHGERPRARQSSLRCVVASFFRR